jgi:agmatinase/guanidinopropionase
VPYDGGTSYRSGARFGPRAIREQSLLLWGYNNAQGVAPFRALQVVDYGDVDVVPVDIVATQQAIERHADAILSQGLKILALGGDHSIALPLLRAHARRHGPLAVVHFDAHPDTWDCEFVGHKFSHGTPFRRAIEEGLIDPRAYVQVGIRGPTAGPQDYQEAIRLGAQLITLDDALRQGIDAVLARIREIIGGRLTYLSLDIDAVDPAFAPGTGTPEVGGFSSREMLQLLRGLRDVKLAGCDIVEVSPPFDHAGITAVLAANLAFECLSLMAQGVKNED